jgi:uncharacterized radical SAM protein YgiQ
MGYLPVTKKEMFDLGWDRADVILVSGDAYIDSPYSGVAVIGQTLVKAGYKVAILSQPDVNSIEDFRSLGEPRLFWGVSCGCVDSMVANYTASGKRRRSDDFTPGGENNRRPDRAAIQYSNAIRAAWKPCKPILLGGVEASLRRISHYDFWSNKVRRPVVCDAKATALSYGMGERSVLAFADAIANGKTWKDIRGICYMASEKDVELTDEVVELPSYGEVAEDSLQGRKAFSKAFRLFSENQDSVTGKKLVQKIDTRYLVHNPPSAPLESDELDAVHNIEWMLDVPPSIKEQGFVRALDTIRFGVTTHRGCYGGCSFCAIAVHQGRRIVSRSMESIEREVVRFARHPKFKGIVSDVGGPTANMYGFDCAKKAKCGTCADRQCLFPAKCPSLKVDHSPQLKLLSRLRSVKGVRKIFVASGIRPDLVAADKACGDAYIKAVAKDHVSGQLKLAPEHVVSAVLECMGKPSVKDMLSFKRKFDAASRALGKKQFLTYYFIAAHPGCTEENMRELKKFAQKELCLNPEQVQIFTPTPLTAATSMYYTGENPFTGEKVYVARGGGERQRQKDILFSGAKSDRIWYNSGKGLKKEACYGSKRYKR